MRKTWTGQNLRAICAIDICMEGRWPRLTNEILIPIVLPARSLAYSDLLPSLFPFIFFSRENIYNPHLISGQIVCTRLLGRIGNGQNVIMPWRGLLLLLHLSLFFITRLQYIKPIQMMFRIMSGGSLNQITSVNISACFAII
jgi:hypothetical protein